MSFDFSKGLAILAALPQIGQLTLNTIGMVESAIPHSGVVGQKIDMVNGYLTKGIQAVSAGVTEIESLIPVVTNFAAQMLTLIEQIKTGVVAAVPPQQIAQTPAPAHA